MAEIEIVITATDETEGGMSSARTGMAGVADEAERMGEATSGAAAGSEEAAASAERLGGAAAGAVADLSQIAEYETQAAAAATAGAVSFADLSDAAAGVGRFAGAAATGLADAADDAALLGQDGEEAVGMAERLGNALAGAVEGLQSFASRAGGAVASLFTVQGIMTALLSLLPEFAAGFLGVGAALAATVIGVGAIILGFDGIKQAFDNFKAEIAPLREALAQIFDSKLTQDFSDFAAVLNGATPEFQDLATAITDIVKALLPGRDAMTAFAGAVEDAANFFERGVKGAEALKDAIGTMSQAAAPELGDIADAISYIYQAWDQAVQKLSQSGVLQEAFEQGAAALHAFGSVLAAVGTVLTEIAAKAGPSFSAAFEQLAQALIAAAPDIAKFIEGLGLIIEAVSKLVNIIAGILEALGPFGQALALLAGVALAVGLVMGPLGAAIGAVATVVGGAIELIGALVTVLTGAGAAAATAGTAVAGGAADFALLGTDVAASIAALAPFAIAAATVVGVIAAVAAAILAVVAIGGEWDQFWSDMGKAFSDFGKMVGDILGGNWSQAWGDAGDVVKDAGNVIIDVLNAIINIMNQLAKAMQSIFGGSMSGSAFVGSNQAIPNIPRFATGGIGDGLAIVGENGPELVNLPGGSSISSNSSLAGALGGTGGGGGNQQLTLVTQSGANSYVATMIMGLVRSGQLQIRRSHLV